MKWSKPIVGQINSNMLTDSMNGQFVGTRRRKCRRRIPYHRMLPEFRSFSFSLLLQFFCFLPICSRSDIFLWNWRTDKFQQIIKFIFGTYFQILILSSNKANNNSLNNNWCKSWIIDKHFFTSFLLFECKQKSAYGFSFNR